MICNVSCFHRCDCFSCCPHILHLPELKQSCYLQSYPAERRRWLFKSLFFQKKQVLHMFSFLKVVRRHFVGTAEFHIPGYLVVLVLFCLLESVIQEERNLGLRWESFPPYFPEHLSSFICLTFLGFCETICH